MIFRFRWLAEAALGGVVSAAGLFADTAEFDHFITRKGSVLYDGEQSFRFVSFNAPALHYIEDYYFDDLQSHSALPTDFEIEDVLITLDQLGGQVTRIYTLAVRKKDDGGSAPFHITGPGCFNETAFRRLDKLIQLANKHHIRLIIPFVDKHDYWGGVPQHAAFRGKPTEAFWTDEQIKNDFKQVIEYVLNRTNHYTGVQYKNDKAVMAWELGNELSNNGQYPGEWIEEMAAFVKKNDSNHLLVCPWAWGVRPHQLLNPHVDIISSHFYPNVCPVEEWVDRVETEIAQTRNKKAYMIGEFGFVDRKELGETVDAVIAGGGSGTLLWGLRGHTRHGGFYWHGEHLKPYQAYHWPGFDSGEPWQERSVLSLMRKKAYQVQERNVPPLPRPEPPVLLASDSSLEMNWLGSAGASFYDVERADSPTGEWHVVGQNVSDAAKPYGALFSEPAVPDGAGFWYRVIARNRSGRSAPSNIMYINNKISQAGK